ncbi:MAG: hypothetical protein AB2797_13825, partial [Candidatus Thiodiazotropha sp.]
MRKIEKIITYSTSRFQRYGIVLTKHSRIPHLIQGIGMCFQKAAAGLWFFHMMMWCSLQGMKHNQITNSSV